MTTIVFLCDVCGKPLMCPKGTDGKFRRDSRQHGSIYFEDSDRLFSNTGFRFNGWTEKATICVDCWDEKIRPGLVAMGVKFEKEEFDPEKDLELGRAPSRYPRALFCSQCGHPDKAHSGASGRPCKLGRCDVCSPFKKMDDVIEDL